ncbi:fibronectin type III-like domain-contianing protein [Cellulomonas sp. NPDC055163]
MTTHPPAPFGFGTGWTTWRYDDAHQVLAADTDAVRLEIDLTNTGTRRGTAIVQVHLEADPVGGLDRPPRWLAGFTTVTAEPGARAAATVRLPRRAFEVWDAARGRWTTPPVRYRARIGRSVRELPLTVEVVPLGVSPARLSGAGTGRARR